MCEFENALLSILKETRGIFMMNLNVRWGLSKIKINKEWKALSIGTEGVKSLLIHCAYVSGIDVFKQRVNRAEKVNASAIRSGLCDIRLLEGATLPYESHSYELVTDFGDVDFSKEVYRILRPGGTYLVCRKVRDFDVGAFEWELKTRGFLGIRTFSNDRDMLAIVAIKPIKRTYS